jgi:hypothetical protein
VGGRAAVEVSAPKRAFGTNVDAMPFLDAVSVLRGAVREAGEFVEVPAVGTDLRLVRVDVVRDFQQVRGWASHAGALQRVVQAPRATVRSFRDAAKGGAWTLGVGNGSWRANTYDKFAESLDENAYGQVRYEFRAGSRICREARCSVAEPGSIGHVALSRFHSSGIGAKVAADMSDVTDRILAAGLSPATTATLLGYVVARGEGVSFGWSEHSERKYLRLMQEIGVVYIRSERSEVSNRLDWDSARMLSEVAA